MQTIALRCQLHGGVCRTLAHADYCDLLRDLQKERQVLQRALADFGEKTRRWEEWYEGASAQYRELHAELTRYRDLYGLLEENGAALEEVDDGMEDLFPEAPEGDQADADLSAALAELDAMMGLGNVKCQVRDLAASIQVDRLRAAAGLRVAPRSLHLVFSGSPGTGKTQVARALGRIYKALGVVQNSTIEEVDRAGLVGQHVGATALKVTAAVERALGGILFIDEAYALCSQQGAEWDFGREAIDTLVKLMEDHREELVVIAAGYLDEMETFLSSNPGLRSRFPVTLYFDDYTDDELVEIFRTFCDEADYVLSDDAEPGLRAYFTWRRKTDGRQFGNGREARNAFEQSIATLATRVMSTGRTELPHLMVIQPEDVPTVSVLTCLAFFGPPEA